MSHKKTYYNHKKEQTIRVVAVGNYYYSKGIDLIMSIVNDTPDIEYHLFGNVFSCWRVSRVGSIYLDYGLYGVCSCVGDVYE